MDKMAPHVEAVLESNFCSRLTTALGRARSILLAAEEKTGIPYWANGEPNVSIDYVIRQLRRGWHFRLRPSSWEGLAYAMMEILGEEHAPRESD